MLNEVAAALYPTHARRIDLFDTKHNGSTLDLTRGLSSKSHIAHWPTFTRVAAIILLFIQMTTDIYVKKEASEILETKPEGDYLLLLEKQQNLENAPWKQNKQGFYGKLVKKNL